MCVMSACVYIPVPPFGGPHFFCTVVGKDHVGVHVYVEFVSVHACACLCVHDRVRADGADRWVSGYVIVSC